MSTSFQIPQISFCSLLSFSNSERCFWSIKISCSEEKNFCLLQVKDDLKNFPITTIRFELIMESFDLLREVRDSSVNHESD